MSELTPPAIQVTIVEGGRFDIWCAENTGFCFGVERAVKLAQDAAARLGKVYSLGPIIHNTDVVDALAKEGILVARNLDEVDDSAVIARSHGLPPDVLEEANRRGIRIIDGTCPFVKKAQDYAALLRREGYHILIVGNADHPEVKALLGFSGHDAQIVGSESDVNLPDGTSRIGVISQTTERIHIFSRVVASVVAQAKEVRVFNTVCDSALSRRSNTLKLAEMCDVVVVVGGKHSANTKQLAAAARQHGTDTYHIERPEELEDQWFEGKRNVGVTVGASTPVWITSAVVKRLREISLSIVRIMD
ncbi:MAG: 4-hydroxy-3-methylbut-2-enyl diphosphate reductase [Candidatus Coatesbacteria bacterium]|nr:4-hydroxy-3-methylbut-2-enyl diphosphate reductase [Candidatus Coatesbacteria bacterium]